MLHSKPKYDPPTLAVLRRALDAVLTDHRLLNSPHTSALEIAEFILAQAATGKRCVGVRGSTSLPRLPEDRPVIPICRRVESPSSGGCPRSTAKVPRANPARGAASHA
jgi:hypothetical protein